MKGVVFVGFLKMVEENYGYEMVDHLITSNELPSAGIYTSVGTYDHREMVLLLSELSVRTGENMSLLLKAFGRYFFSILNKGYPHFFEASENVFDFFISIENYIHVEVKKLYPDAELPNFEIQLIDDNCLEMIYSSERKMADFAAGLIETSLEFYKEEATIDKYNLTEDGGRTKFIITKKQSRR